MLMQSSRCLAFFEIFPSTTSPWHLSGLWHSLPGHLEEKAEVEKIDNGKTMNSYACCPLMQSWQAPAFGCPVLCFGSVQLAKRLQSEVFCTHVHHLQSSFLPQNLWQDSALVIFSKLTEYSWSRERGKYIKQENKLIVQRLAKRLFPCCMNMGWE